MENDSNKKNELLNNTSKVILNNIEKLRFQNLQLQKQNINLQEENIMKDILIRTGVDAKGWNMDLNTGVCTPREKTSGL